MTALRLSLAGDNIGERIRRQLSGQQSRINKASEAAIAEVKDRIITAGKADMIAGGNFGSARWQNSLGGDLRQNGQTYYLDITHQVPFWRVFEYGATIKGRPLLWIPLPWNTNKVSAKDFPGKLFRVDRQGKNPLLMTPGKPAQAMYVGVTQVVLRRRFHLRPIIARVAKQMPSIFKKWFRIARSG